MQLNQASQPNTATQTATEGPALEFDKKRMYIAGKVTGLPYEEVYRKFNHAANYLTTLGFTAINPIKHVPEDTPWQEAMRTCIRQLATCDGIYLLRDYHQSKGALLEHHIACAMGLTIIHEYV
ncbi:DUF4406 domain-containing protein [Limnovirga soli]|uniref:DUF4406 domain-containing protein n=1 Tax=Limnovirga soli TaxID=2656915 RepID=A0A8J8JTE8_9BACT|nr:DUF4406 domain-containing protein [Limnovirga soli]NNV54559.1 DUF4406 domain-containing protein [Limnovirga soli]